jgi:sigma-B regulation protein RsbU (phosphoserine phosphatase)
VNFDRREELQDVLLDLQQARREASEERRVREALISGLGIIAAPRPPEEMASEMLTILAATIDFEHAALLVSDEGDELRAWSTTTPNFDGTTWQVGPLFSRALQGEIIPVFDVSPIPEWSGQPELVREGVMSAIHVGISGGGYRALLICTHSSRGHFTASDVRLLEGFVPLASQAMQNAWTHELQQRERQEQAARRLAESRLGLLDHAMDSIGVGVAIWRRSADLIQASPVLEDMVERFGGARLWWPEVEPLLGQVDALRCDRCGEVAASGTARAAMEGPGGPAVFLMTFAGHLDDPSGGSCLGEVVLITDISDRERLSEEFEALSRLPDSNPDPVLRVDRDGVLRFANPGADALLRHWDIEVGASVPDAVRHAVGGLLESGGTAHVEILLEGLALDLLIVGIPGSEVAHVYGRDVTEARAVRLALEESEARTRLLIDASLDAVVTMDGHGRVVDWSPRAEELFGWTEKEAVGGRMSDMIIPESLRQAHERGLKHYLTTGEGPVLGVRIEVPACHKSGEEIPVELFIRVLEAAEDGGRLFAGFIRDVREQRRAADALTKANSRLSTLIESTASGVLVEDESGRITLLNRSFCQLFGIGESADELKGSDARVLMALVAAESVESDRIRTEIESLRSGGGGPPTREVRFADGRLLELEYVPVRSGEDFLGHMWQFRDITTYRAAEAAIQETRLREVELGEEIQDLFLRGRPPENHPAVDIAVLSAPSRGLDGDFVDFIEHGEDILDVLVGDVMGKGLPASLLGAAAKNSFSRALARAEPGEDGLPSPDEVMAYVHNALAERLIAVESFVTMVYTRLDLANQEAVYVDCGHPKTIHLSARTGQCRRLSGSDPPLGFASRNRYRAHRARFEAGDVLVLYSDGITETFSPRGEMLGEERLIAAVRRNAHQTPAEIVRAVKRLVEDFAGEDDPRSDDLTLVVVRIRHSWDPPAETPVLDRRMIVPRDSRRLVEFRALLDAFTREAFEEVGAGWLLEVQRAGQEAITNAMRHSEPEDPASPLDVRLQAMADRLIIEIRYDGVEFQPGEVSLPDVLTYPEGGFGLFIIEQSVDDVRYGIAVDGRNYLRIVKKLG